MAHTYGNAHFTIAIIIRLIGICKPATTHLCRMQMFRQFIQIQSTTKKKPTSLNSQVTARRFVCATLFRASCDDV